MAEEVVKAGYSTPMLHVASIEKSIAFYELLGFKLIDSTDEKPLEWARLHCESGSLMFLRAEHTVDPSKQGFLLYMYTPDLPALREQLVAAGVNAGLIKRPEYMPSGMINFRDPDGYIIEIGQWGREDHERWEKHLAERAMAAQK